MSPIIAPIPEAIIPATNSFDCGKSPLIIVPRTKLPKLNFIVTLFLYKK